MPEQFNINKVFQNFIKLIENKDISLALLTILFWILFYGVFMLALRKLPMMQQEGSNKLAKIISGALSGIMVLGALVVAPRGRMIQYAQDIMSSFNVLFAIFLAILFFIIIKNLLGGESKGVQTQGAAWGGLIALFLFGQLGQGGILAYYAQVGSWFMMWFLFFYGLWYIYDNAFGSSRDVIDPGFSHRLDKLRNEDDLRKRERGLEKEVNNLSRRVRSGEARRKSDQESLTRKVAERLNFLNGIKTEVESWKPDQISKLKGKNERNKFVGNGLKSNIDESIGELESLSNSLKTFKSEGIDALFTEMDNVLDLTNIDSRFDKIKALESRLAGLIEIEIKALKRLNKQFDEVDDKIPHKTEFESVKNEIETMRE